MEEPIIKGDRLNDTFQDPLDAEPQQIDSEILRTLIKEVHVEESFEISAYNTLPQPAKGIALGNSSPRDTLKNIGQGTTVPIRM